MEDVILVARLFLFVREAVSQNNGQRVNAIQFWSGGKDALGTSWCCWLCTMVLDLVFQGNSPIPRQGVVADVYALAVKNGWLTNNPQPGDLFVYLDANGHPHHIGFYVQGGVEEPQGLAGNTDATGTSTNGDRVAEHPLHTSGTIEYIAYPRS